MSEQKPIILHLAWKKVNDSARKKYIKTLASEALEEGVIERDLFPSNNSYIYEMDADLAVGDINFFKYGDNNKTPDIAQIQLPENVSFNESALVGIHNRCFDEFGEFDVMIFRDELIKAIDVGEGLTLGDLSVNYTGEAIQHVADELFEDYEDDGSSYFATNDTTLNAMGFSPVEYI